MKYFLDTEFIENGSTIDLISIGIVCEDGREYYAQNDKCDFKKGSDWVWRNVYPHLKHFDMSGVRKCQPKMRCNGDPFWADCYNSDCPWRNHYDIRDEVKKFMDVDKYGKPEIWGYYADYDWVAFAQLFGTMTNLPKGFPMYCRDIKQLCDSLGNPTLPKYPDAIHNALDDARWNKKAWEFLMVMDKQVVDAVFTPPQTNTPKDT